MSQKDVEGLGRKMDPALRRRVDALGFEDEVLLRVEAERVLEKLDFAGAGWHIAVVAIEASRPHAAVRSSTTEAGRAACRREILKVLRTYVYWK